MYRNESLGCWNKIGKHIKVNNGEFFDMGASSWDKGFINILVRTPGNDAMTLEGKPCKSDLQVTPLLGEIEVHIVENFYIIEKGIIRVYFIPNKGDGLVLL